MTATRASLLARAAALGVAVEDDGVSLNILCPAGLRLVGTGTHWLRIDNLPRGAWTRPAMYAALLDDLALGVEPCADPDCDYCREDG